MVKFKSGRWRISTHAPGPRQDKKRLGISYRAAWKERDRVVEVRDGGEQIAYLANPKEEENLSKMLEWLGVKRNKNEVKTADEQSVTLQRPRSLVTAGALTIKKVKGNYVLTPTSPVPLPLEAALLHWHVRLGDFSGPSSDTQ